MCGGARLLTRRGNEIDAATRQDLIGSLADEANRLFELIENLIAIGRTNLLANVTLQEVDLSREIEATVASYANRAPNRKIETALDPDARLVRGESTYIRQVLDNLLANANKYSPEEGVIQVTSEARPDEVLVSVLDEGSGVPEKEVKTIFDAFFRSQATSGKVSGKGLGLAVCKRLTEAQGGRIWAVNRPEGGLQVTFSLLRVPDPVTSGALAGELSGLDR
jgi:two-component system sensor histidine kinase KdpD